MKLKKHELEEMASDAHQDAYDADFRAELARQRGDTARAKTLQDNASGLESQERELRLAAWPT